MVEGKAHLTHGLLGVTHSVELENRGCFGHVVLGRLDPLDLAGYSGLSGTGRKRDVPFSLSARDTTARALALRMG